MANDTSCAVHQVIDLLKERDLQKVVSFLEDPENSEIVRNNAWDFIPVVCSSLKKNDSDDNLDDFSLYESILLTLTNKGNPKEILLGLLEAADCFKTDSCFSVFLRPLQKVLLLIPGRRGKSLEEVLSTLYAHVLSLPVPQDYNLEGDERLLLDLDPSVQRTGIVLGSYLEFFGPFVEEVSNKLGQEKEVFYLDRIARQKEILGTYLLRLLHHPLMYHDLHYEIEKPKSSMRQCCEKIIRHLTKMFSNVLILYELPPRNECSVTYASDCSDKNFVQLPTKKPDDSSDGSTSNCAIATLAYLIFSENLASDSHPYVYSHNFMFQMHLPLVISLLSKTENLVLYKGLSLVKFFIVNLCEHELSCECLEMDSFVVLPKLLTNIAVHCPVEEHRYCSVALLRSYIDKYDWKGRYRLLLLMISSVKHAGVLGLVINLYKNYLHICLSQSLPDCFVNKDLYTFLTHALKLPEGAETDLLENSDKIMSALNLLRYLVLRDKRQQNVTGIWTFINSISESFLKPLQTGLVLSKAHYKLEKQRLMEGKHNKDDVINAVVSVDGQVLPNIPIDNKREIIDSALLVFDMMESVLMRVNEVINILTFPENHMY